MTSVNTDDFSPEVRNAAWWSGDSRLAANGRAADAILVKQGKKQPQRRRNDGILTYRAISLWSQ